MDERWVWAASAVGVGLAAGALAGVFIRRVLDRPGRRDAAREISGPLSIFVFWVLFATGILVAVGVSSPDRLETIPTDILEWLPNLAIAGLLLIGGYAFGLTVATTVGRALSRVSGTRTLSLERTVRAAVLAAATILALNQLGVDTTVIDILIAGLVFALAIVLSGLSILGGRKMAEQIAAGRALGNVLVLGDRIECGSIAGTVDELLPTHVALTTEKGRLVVPYGVIADVPVLIVGNEQDMTGEAPIVSGS